MIKIRINAHPVWSCGTDHGQTVFLCQFYGIHHGNGFCRHHRNPRHNDFHSHIKRHSSAGVQNTIFQRKPVFQRIAHGFVDGIVPSDVLTGKQKLLSQGGTEALVENMAEKDALLHGLGINVNLAPVADVSTNSGDFIYDRTFGLDAEGTSDCVTAVVEQMAADGLGSVLKHFPGYGSNVDTHTGIAVDQRPLEQFESADFLPFSAGMAAGNGTTAVLVSHNIMTAVDESLPASLSPAVHDLLREELGFDGVVMTDDLAMDAVAAYSTDGAVAVMALQAGNDLIITTDYRTQIPKVLEAVENGTLSPDTIDTACRRVLTWKQALGLL